MTEKSKRDLIIDEARRIAVAPIEPKTNWDLACARFNRVSAISFYDSAQWLELRYRALKRDGGHCLCCGNAPVPGNPLQVDHIKPRSKFPELELDLENLQVLCRSCNMGKGAWDQTDWRPRT